MKLDRFINRPVLSTVISILIVILGVIGLATLPITQYPDIAPPTVSVSATYQGANAQTVLNSVIAPLEDQINGVENMMYMSSSATNSSSGDYQETYFQKVELADRQPLYVSRTTHEKLMRIVTVIGGRKVTVSSYVENILLRHFEQYQDEINTLYESHFQKPV